MGTSYERRVVDMKKRIIEKLKSPIVWTSFIALVLELLVQLGLDEIVPQTKAIMTFLLACVILFGVLNDPNSKDKF